MTFWQPTPSSAKYPANNLRYPIPSRPLICGKKLAVICAFAGVAYITFGYGLMKAVMQ